jgi:hypothetical protein
VECLLSARAEGEAPLQSPAKTPDALLVQAEPLQPDPVSALFFLPLLRQTATSIQPGTGN